MKRNKLRKWILIIILFWIIPLSSRAYSVLTHEAIIDANWDKYLLPLLKQKYPNATADQVKEARAYVYGGSVAPDMGYYPFGSKLFTNLIHYVRTGDFVRNLLEEAEDINEYAFALGVLCHYNADAYGHRLGVNVSVPLVYPEEQRKFGNVVTYAEDKTSHIRVEFAFDVLQTARGNYASTAYHDFIGFQVSKPVLERAFLKTYGLDVNDLFGNFNRSVNTFRWAVKNLFPEVTKIAWVSRKNEIKNITPTATSRKFIYRMHRIQYRHDFGRDYNQPGFFARVFAVLIKILPKVGPLKAMKYKEPGPQAEKYFIQSFDTVAVHYENDISKLKTGDLSLPNADFDTGNNTALGEYSLTDKTYLDWLLKLKDKNFETVNPDMKKNILNFYSGHNADLAAKNSPDNWKKTSDALEQLKTVKVKMD